MIGCRLQKAVHAVAERRDDDARRLRHDHVAHHLGTGLKPSALPALLWPSGTAEDAGAHDLGEIGGFVQDEAEEGGFEHAEAHADRKRQACVDDQELDQKRRAAKEPDIRTAR